MIDPHLWPLSLTQMSRSGVPARSCGALSLWVQVAPTYHLSDHLHSAPVLRVTASEPRCHSHPLWWALGEKAGTPGYLIVWCSRHRRASASLLHYLPLGEPVAITGSVHASPKTMTWRPVATWKGGQWVSVCGTSPGGTDILPPEQGSSLLSKNGTSFASVNPCSERSVSTNDKGGLSKETGIGKNYSRGRKG